MEQADKKMLSNRDLLYQNKTELILYIARQSNIAIAAKRFYRGLSLIFLLCVVYSFFRNAVERQFRVTVQLFSSLLTLG